MLNPSVEGTELAGRLVGELKITNI